MENDTNVLNPVMLSTSISYLTYPVFVADLLTPMNLTAITEDLLVKIIDRGMQLISMLRILRWCP